MSQTARLRRFKARDLPAVKKLVDRTIDLSYADHYCARAIAFFKPHHATERIAEDASLGYTVVLEQDRRILGTGTILHGEIRRMFIDPTCQHRGLGGRIMRQLLRHAASNGLAAVKLDSSLPAKPFYESFGFTVVRACSMPVGGRGRLKYYEMTKAMQ